VPRNSLIRRAEKVLNWRTISGRPYDDRVGAGSVGAGSVGAGSEGQVRNLPLRGRNPRWNRDPLLLFL
jgi:hypothetical protein